MAHGEVGVLAGIQEREDEEFGQMGSGPTGAERGPTGAERAVSTPFRRVLDASLRAVQGTPSDALLAADIEAEIVRRTEEAITNRMSMFQQPAPMGWDAQWHTQQGSFPGPAWGAPPADVQYVAQGYPPPSFGRGGQGSIYASSQWPRSAMAAGPALAAPNDRMQQRWLPERVGAQAMFPMPAMGASFRGPPPTVVARQQMSALPSMVAIDQSASLFEKLESVLQELCQRVAREGPQFWQLYLKNEHSLRAVNLGEGFTMAPFERGASAALRTTLRHLLDVLHACNGLAPHRDHYSLLLLARKFCKYAKPVYDRAYAIAMRAAEGSRIRVFFECMLVAYVDPNTPKLLKQFKRQTLLSWKHDTPIHEIREAVLALMHEWTQAVEDTATASGLQRLDDMTEKMWLEALEEVWPPWVGALYQTDPHQFDNTVEELFHFLQTREPETTTARRCVGLTALGVQDFARLTVEEALQIGANHQLSGLLALSRQVRCWRCLGNHYLADCRAQRSPEEIAGAQRAWPPMPQHPSQSAIHQLALGPAASQPDSMVDVMAAIQEMRTDLQTQQASFQDYQAQQDQMAAALLDITLLINKQV